jgi:hypothetical protein
MNVRDLSRRVAPVGSAGVGAFLVGLGRHADLPVSLAVSI